MTRDLGKNIQLQEEKDNVTKEQKTLGTSKTMEIQKEKEHKTEQESNLLKSGKKTGPK